jgi:hypothetical protein
MFRAPMTATTVAEYMASLSEDRRAALAKVRDTINANLPAGYEEGIQYGMISWYVPLSRYPDTYNGQALALASLGSQKNYMALYLMVVYGDEALNTWFRKAFADAGKKLDMGKSCVRFKTVDALALDVIGQAIGKVDVDRYVAIAEAAHSTPARAERSAARAEAKTPTKIATTTATKSKPTAKATPKAKTKTKPKVKARTASGKAKRRS